ncbi:MAG: YaiO family outer membrane beta-barrel protein [Sulfuricaulis sp.]|nr:YaiO family outer membrane beta-barrel protein [Sulfuricaulis sp.]
MLAAAPLEGGHAAATGALSELAEQHTQESLQVPPMSAQRYLTSSGDDSEPAGPGRIQGVAAGARPGRTDAILASHAVQPFKRMEIGWGLSADASAMNWYGVYLKNLDRVAERNTIYGMLRETPRFGPNDSKAPSALCCQSSGTVISLDQHENAITRIELSPTFFVFGLLRNKGYALKLDDDWKLQSGVRHMQYGYAHQTRLAFFTVERRWTNFRTSYSYQLERGDGTLAPSHVLQLDFLYSPYNSIGVSFANGREFADFGSLGVLNTEVRNVTVRGQHWFKQDWALTVQAGYNDHGSLPAQKGFRIGIRHSF